MMNGASLAHKVWLDGSSLRAGGGYEVIWILLAMLGVPIWLVLGALGGALWSRRTFQRAPGVFPCKIRTVSRSESPGKWTRATTYARWVHDVLLVHAGLALVRFRAVPVAGVDESVAQAPDVKLKGGDLVSIRLRLDDGSVVEVAAPKSMQATLRGPFLALQQETMEAPTR
jgi:hypothetical protein